MLVMGLRDASVKKKGYSVLLDQFFTVSVLSFEVFLEAF